MDGMWFVTPQPGTWETERTSGGIKLKRCTHIYTDLGASLGGF